MNKNFMKKLKIEINNVNDIETMREICQRVSDKMNFGINFKIVTDDEVVSTFNQIKECVRNV